MVASHLDRAAAVGRKLPGGLAFRVHVVGVLVLLHLVASVSPAWGSAYVYSDGYREYYPDTVTGWRGVEASLYAYAWEPYLQYPDGSHVSSIYIHDTPINFYEGDGYFDGQGVNWRHLEVGLFAEYNLPSALMFYQYNADRYNVDASVAIDFGVAGTPNEWYAGFRIENTSMGNQAPEDWRIMYGGALVRSLPQFPMLNGEALISSERVYLGDNNTASFMNLRRKNSAANWRDWQDARPAYDGDGGYHFTKVSETHILHEPY